MDAQRLVRPWIPPTNSWLGVIGGGQLGRMFVHAGQSLGFRIAVLESDVKSSAGAAANSFIISPYDDADGLEKLIRQCQAISIEFENVPANSLRLVERRRRVCPSASSVVVAQNRLVEKKFIISCKVPVVEFKNIASAGNISEITGSDLPGILKTSTLGYDGKGQVRVSSPEQLAQAWDKLQRVPCILERVVDLQAELSVIVARGSDGQIVHLPVQENVHRDGILAVTRVPARAIGPEQAEEAIRYAITIAESLDYVGVLCVEFFLLTDGRILANEMAPRPHNSGHYSIDACDISQFELQVRTLAGLPLVTPRLHSPAVMLNLLGDLWLKDGDEAVEPPWDEILALPGVHLHLYGKTEPRRGRKMGHVTVTAVDAESAESVAREVAQRLGLPAP